MSPAPPLPQFKGLVFDLDGVLILSRSAHRRAFNEVLAPFGIDRFDYDSYAGWRTPDVFRSVFSEFKMAPGELTISECAARKSARAREILAEEDCIAPDCAGIIEHISKRYSLALASSGSRQSVNAFLDRTGLRGNFQSVLSGDDVERAKPDPELFTRSIQALGLRPSECAVIEDAAAGIEAARLAGATAIGIGDDPSLACAGACRVVGSLPELAQLLQTSWKPPTH